MHITPAPFAVVLAAAACIAAPVLAQDPTGELPPIAVVDVYGTTAVSDSAVRAAAGLVPGAAPPGPAEESAVRKRLLAVRGVRGARVDVICCDGGTLVYLGIEEESAEPLRFRSAPTGAVRLPAAVCEAGTAFEAALHAAVLSGNVGEDDSLGYSLMHDPAARRVQQQFTRLADEYGEQLRTVLRESGDEAQRALAAQVLAYAPDRRQVVDDLVFAAADPSPMVRNNAVRGLAVLGSYAARHPKQGVTVPAEPLIGLLRSPVWTDRNKASFALMQIVGPGRDSALVARLGREVLPELVEMAEWQSLGHALPALILLARIGGVPDEQIGAVVQGGDRAPIIRAAEQAASR